MAHQINAFSPVANSFVIHYLGEEPNILKKANPSKGLEKILQKLYSASIDMLMPTQASQISEISGYYEVPIFVTFDQGMKLLFDSLLISGEHKLESGVKVPKYSFMIFYSSGWSDEEIYELSQFSFEMQKEKRMTKENKMNELLRLNKLAMKLEEELAKNLNYGLLSTKP
jgi:peroxiredoxin family protein